MTVSTGSLAYWTAPGPTPTIPQAALQRLLRAPAAEPAAHEHAALWVDATATQGKPAIIVVKFKMALMFLHTRYTSNACQRLVAWG